MDMQLEREHGHERGRVQSTYVNKYMFMYDYMNMNIINLLEHEQHKRHKLHAHHEIGKRHGHGHGHETDTDTRYIRKYVMSRKVRVCAAECIWQVRYRRKN
jgi:hypothetical protein